MNVTLILRPDLNAAVNYFSRFQACATDSHWNGLKRILAFIKGTVHLKLFHPKSNSVETVVGYADASHGEPPDGKSTSGFLLEVFGAAVVWNTKRQTAVAPSTAESEMIALKEACDELLWILNLLMELRIKFALPVKMFEDNQPCIKIVQKWDHKSSKTINVKCQFVLDLYSKEVIDVIYIPTENQKADIFTKGIARDRFKKLSGFLGLI